MMMSISKSLPFNAETNPEQVAQKLWESPVHDDHKTFTAIIRRALKNPRTAAPHSGKSADGGTHPDKKDSHFLHSRGSLVSKRPVSALFRGPFGRTALMTLLASGRALLCCSALRKERVSG